MIVYKRLLHSSSLCYRQIATLFAPKVALTHPNFFLNHTHTTQNNNRIWLPGYFLFILVVQVAKALEMMYNLYPSILFADVDTVDGDKTRLTNTDIFFKMCGCKTVLLEQNEENTSERRGVGEVKKMATYSRARTLQYLLFSPSLSLPTSRLYDSRGRVSIRVEIVPQPKAVAKTSFVSPYLVYSKPSLSSTPLQVQNFTVEPGMFSSVLA